MLEWAREEESSEVFPPTSTIVVSALEPWICEALSSSTPAGGTPISSPALGQHFPFYCLQLSLRSPIKGDSTADVTLHWELNTDLCDSITFI